MVGEILDLLEELGIEEETMIWFSGDNGPDDHDLEFFDS